MTGQSGNVNWRRLLLAAFCALAAPAAPDATLQAQAGLGHLEDATVVPRGLFRLRATTVWTRFDERFIVGGREPLGGSFTSGALGRAQLPAFNAVDSLASLATGQPLSLSLGQSRLDARGRHEILPLGIEYGLTRRITVGAMIPIVRRRVTVQLRLDSTGATVGPNLHRTLSTAASTNALLQTQFAGAANQLQDRLASCRASGGAGCPELLAQEAEALALIASSQEFASAVGALYGTATSEGMAFVPRADSPVQADIAFRVADFNTRYRDLLASGSDVLTAVPVGAGGPAGLAELQDYLTRELDGDSLATEERSGIGDNELGVKLLLLDRNADSTRRVGMRATAAAIVRLATGSRQSPSPITDLRLGDGLNLMESRVALDVHAGRFGVLAVGDAAFGLKEEDLGAPAGAASGNEPDSRWFGLHVAPRVHLSPPFAVHGAWTLRTANVSGSQSTAGGGVSYSTMQRYRAAGGPLPLEMRFTHLESLSGPPGFPKFMRDQIEVRIYFGR